MTTITLTTSNETGCGNFKGIRVYTTCAAQRAAGMARRGKSARDRYFLHMIIETIIIEVLKVTGSQSSPAGTASSSFLTNLTLISVVSSPFS